MTLSEDAASAAPADQSAQRTALHVDDAAFTAHRMIGEATKRGYTRKHADTKPPVHGGSVADAVEATVARVHRDVMAARP